MNLLDNLTLDDLDNEQRELAECIGLEAYKKLITTYAGSYVYICKGETITVEIRNRAIKSEFNGYNYLELARKYDLSERAIRYIVSDQLQRVKAEPLENQITMFDTEN